MAAYTVSSELGTIDLLTPRPAGIGTSVPSLPLMHFFVPFFDNECMDHELDTPKSQNRGRPGPGKGRPGRGKSFGCLFGAAGLVRIGTDFATL